MSTETNTHSGPRRGNGQHGIVGHVGALTRETARLVQDEVDLARIEMSEKLESAKTGTAALISSAAVLAAGVMTLCASATFALGLIMPLWAGALIVGGVISLVGLGLLSSRRRKLDASTDPRPHAAIAEARQTRHDLKERFQ